MADNVRLSAGTADGATVATDDDGTAQHQYVKLEFGPDNTQTKVADASPLPVKITDGTDVALVSAGGALLVDASATTQPVSIAAVPSHAVTNAGTFAVQVDGAALTSLQLIDDTVQVLGTDTYTEATSKGITLGAVRRDADTTLVNTTNEFGPLQMDANGRLKVEVFDGGDSHTVDNNGTFAVQASLSAAIPAGTNNIGDVDVLSVPADPFGANADAASATGSISAKLRFIAATGIPITGTVTVGSHAVTNAGTFVVQENGSALTALQKIDDPVLVDDAGFTPATSSVMMAGFEADETATDSVDEGDAGAARMTLDRKQIVTLQPHTAGGLSTFMASGSDGSSILVATAQAIKASAGQMYGYYAYNPEAAVTFVHFYNTAAASVTVGTTNPLFTIQIPAASAANLTIPQGILFSNAGWSCAATTTAGGNTAPSTGVSLTVWYA